MDGSPQRTAIQTAWDAFPLRADLPTAGAQAPTVEAANLTFANSPRAPDPDAQEVAPGPSQDGTESSSGPVGTTVEPLVDNAAAAGAFCSEHVLAICHLVALLLFAFAA